MPKPRLARNRICRALPRRCGWRGAAKAPLPDGLRALQLRLGQGFGAGAQQRFRKPLAAQFLQHALRAQQRGAPVQHGFGDAGLVDEAALLKQVQQRGQVFALLHMARELRP